MTSFSPGSIFCNLDSSSIHRIILNRISWAVCGTWKCKNIAFLFPKIQLLPSYMFYMGPSIDYYLNVNDLVMFECTVLYCVMVGIIWWWGGFSVKVQSVRTHIGHLLVSYYGYLHFWLLHFCTSSINKPCCVVFIYRDSGVSTAWITSQASYM